LGLNYTSDQMDQSNIHETFYPRVEEYTFLTAHDIRTLLAYG
jgi:hypothetical protein